MTDLTALEEAAKKEAPTHDEFRAIGWTGDAAMFRKSDDAQQAFEAWYGRFPDGHEFPETFKYAPNETCHAAWERVGAIAAGLRSRIRDLERERDEARKAGMMRAAEIAEARDATNPFAPLDTPESWARQQIAAAIRAEAERGGK